MTELSFLIDLLLNHKLPQKTKDAVAERIKTVEALVSMVAPRIPTAVHMSQPTQSSVALIGGTKQAASTAAALAKYPDLVEQMEKSATKPVQTVAPAPQPDLPPVEVVAQTPQTAAAIASRQAAIATAISGKPEKGRTSPRKF